MVKIYKKILDDLFGRFEIPDIFKGKDRERPIVSRKQFPKDAFTASPDPLNDMDFIVLQEMGLYFCGTMKVTKNPRS